MSASILVMSHAHPDFSLGGGEIAAYNLFKAYQLHPDVSAAWFLARADRQRGATGAITLRRENEYLWEQSVVDWFNMKAAHQDSLINGFTELLRALKPSVVHTHHYAHLGLEYLRVIKQVDPSVRIVMTLHEYMAICHNQGQMIKKGSMNLCSRESYDECQRCFPEKSAEDFWLRKHYFSRHFDLVDHFIAPSDFLRQRYIDWGISPEKIDVIENGQHADQPLPPRTLAEGEKRNRFGFFGQINPFKGLDILLKALNEMSKRQRQAIVLEVHGANLESQSLEYQQKIETLRKPLIKEGVVQWIGPYQPNELRKRMAGIDWVVVPSIWWENSPMVIQEAFACGRPLLVSDIGGMKEKVWHGVNGVHVDSRSTQSWGDRLTKIASDSSLHMKLSLGIRPPIDRFESANRHIRLIQKIY